VSSAAYSHKQLVSGCKSDGLDHIGRALTANDDAGLSVDHRIPNGSGLIITRSALDQHLATKRSTYRVKSNSINSCCSSFKRPKFYGAHDDLPERIHLAAFNSTIDQGWDRSRGAIHERDRRLICRSHFHAAQNVPPKRTPRCFQNAQRSHLVIIRI